MTDIRSLVMKHWSLYDWNKIILERKKESLLEHLEHNNYNAKCIQKSSKKLNTSYNQGKPIIKAMKHWILEFFEVFQQPKHSIPTTNFNSEHKHWFFVAGIEIFMTELISILWSI